MSFEVNDLRMDRQMQARRTCDHKSSPCHYVTVELKVGPDTSCKLSPKEKICMQILFSGKKKKNIISLSSAEFANNMESVKRLFLPASTVCWFVLC